MKNTTLCGIIGGTLVLTAALWANQIRKDYNLENELKNANLKYTETTHLNARQVYGFYDTSSNLTKIVVRETPLNMEGRPLIVNTEFLTSEDKEFAKYAQRLKQ